MSINKKSKTRLRYSCQEIKNLENDYLPYLYYKNKHLNVISDETCILW